MMKNLKLESLEIRNDKILLYGKYHIDNYAFVSEKIKTDSEKIANALNFDDLPFRILYMLDEKTKEELDFDERLVEDMLLNMCFHIKKISNLELRKKIEECILQLYEDETIVQINNVLLYLNDDYEGKDYDFIRDYRHKCEILKKIYILDIYLSYDIKDLDLKVFDYEQLLEIHEGLKNDVDVRLYANPKLNWSRMKIIRKTLEDYDIDVSKYVEANFTENEIDEIVEGLESGIDVSAYADNRLHYEEMREIREKLEEGKRIYKLRYDNSQLDIIIKALEDAKAYYEQNLFDSYKNFDELEKIIKSLKAQLPHKLW
ncbi:hypothetical protein [Finegoldia magna]|uniref:Uncharacterized protein n=2 Tax=Finegoldia magna TaxID=1260 RepID=B0S4A5_FINM2|nr:hypothetical protein [Finegoldia magna]BAG09096.1 conserved hypothetical protein [Finegoldia magna ATCC 29328]